MSNEKNTDKTFSAKMGQLIANIFIACVTACLSACLIALTVRFITMLF